MMAGNPNWWSIINGSSGNCSYGNSPFFHGNPNFSSLISPNYSSHHHHHQHHHQDHFPVRSWSQLLLGGGGVGGEERFQFQQQKKVVENIWMNINNNSSSPAIDDNNDDDDNDDIKRQILNYSSSSSTNQIFHPSPYSTTTSTTTFFNFSGTNTTATASPPPRKRNHHRQDLQASHHEVSEGVQAKKGRVQHSSSAQPALKVRKEKLGDRITTLHQLVSPFGKTDTASVLSEAIASITFLHAQIQALNSPYMRNSNNNNTSSSSSGNSSILHIHHSESEGAGAQDLRSRGLCLVPISCTQNYVAGNYLHHDDADYWHGGSSSAF